MTIEKIIKELKCPYCGDKYFLFDEFEIGIKEVKLYRCMNCLQELNVVIFENEIDVENSFIATIDGEIKMNFTLSGEKIEHSKEQNQRDLELYRQLIDDKNER